MGNRRDKNNGLDPILHDHGHGYMPLTRNMFKSISWRNLNGRQKDLWFLAEMQFQNAKIHEKRKSHIYSDVAKIFPDRYPADKWEYLMNIVQRPCFYLNEALVCEKGEQLYKTGNRKTFFSDRKALVSAGFLEEIPVTNKKGEHVMNVYTLSDRWWKRK